MKKVLCIFILLSSLNLYSQVLPDSLNRIISLAQDDEATLEAYNALGETVHLTHPDSAIRCFRNGLRIAENLLIDSSSMDAPRLRRIKVLMAASLNNLGYMLTNIGRIEEAILVSARCLSLQEELADTNGIAMSLNNIAAIYNGQGEVEKTLEFFTKSLELRIAMKDSFGIAMSLHNLGLVYQTHHQMDLGLEYNLRSLAIRERLNDKFGLATTLNNIASIYLSTGKHEEALKFYERSLSIRQDINDRKGIAICIKNIGILHRKLRNYDLAMSFGLEALETALELKYPEEVQVSARLLYGLYRREKNWEKALEMYELHIQMRDSVLNETTHKAMIRQQTKYEFEKAQLVKEQEEKEAARIIVEETSRRDNLQYSVILIALLVIGGLLSVIGRFSIPIRVLEGFIFFSFLILFEFILVLADPYIDQWSSGAPGIQLLFNAGIAAFIFPLHAFFETKMKGRLVK